LIKIILLSLFIIAISEARENPFFPSIGEDEMMYSSNKDTTISPLKRATISLPTTARVLESVKVTYKNLDGSVEEKTISLENSIDWHLPIFISQSYSQNNDSQKSLSVVKSINKKENFKKIASIKHAEFYTLDKSLKIKTKDKLIRDFLLVKPHRIVLDFQRDTNLKSYIKSNSGEYFKKIRVGNHNGYYRVVIELDGYYRYELNKTDNGYKFNLQ